MEENDDGGDDTGGKGNKKWEEEEEAKDGEDRDRYDDRRKGNKENGWNYRGEVGLNV